MKHKHMSAVLAAATLVLGTGITVFAAGRSVEYRKEVSLPAQGETFAFDTTEVPEGVLYTDEIHMEGEGQFSLNDAVYKDEVHIEGVDEISLEDIDPEHAPEQDGLIFQAEVHLDGVDSIPLQ